jgi:hypothetical protein
MGHDHDVSVWVLLVETAGHPGYPFGNVVETLIGKLKTIGMVEVGLKFARKVLGDGCPWVALPAIEELPIAEPNVNLHGHAGARGNLFSSTEGAFEGRGPNGDHGSRAKVATHPPCLFQTVW